MPLGNSANTDPASLNAAVGNMATQLRNLMQSNKNFTEWFNGLTLTQVETAFGLSSADATTMQQLMGYFTTLSGVYYGTAAQPTDFNFDNALSVLWGGQ